MVRVHISVIITFQSVDVWRTSLGRGWRGGIVVSPRLLTNVLTVYIFHRMMALYLRFLYHRRRVEGRAMRIFRDRSNPLDYMNDIELIQKYRLDRRSILQVCDELTEGLRRHTRRSVPMSVSLQVMVALRYYATGSFQSALSDVHGVSRMTVSRCVHRVSHELSRRLHQHIRFPSTAEEIIHVKQGFYSIGHFPNVVGAVDGSFIPIIAPSVDEHLYVTRKGFHAINIQGICDADNLFLDIVVKWPGCTHDSYMWNNCNVSQLFESGQLPNTWLLGDSAYALKPWMMTPLMSPATRAERRYNVSHKRTRCVVERTYGIWKSRFRCLHKSGGCMMFSPQRDVKVIAATAVLHNICVRNRIPIQVEDDQEDHDLDMPDDDTDGQRRDVDGRMARQVIIDTYF